MTARAGRLIVVLLLLGASACAWPRPLIPKDPLTVEEHVTLGQIYASQGQRDLAKREYQAALTRQSNNVPALVALGNLAFEGGSLQEAEQQYQRALSVSPDHPGAANNLAMVYLSRGERLEEVERLAHQALERSGPLRPYVLETLATLYVRQGRYEEAQAAVDEAERTLSSPSPALRDRLLQLRQELKSRPVETNSGLIRPSVMLTAIPQ